MRQKFCITTKDNYKINGYRWVPDTQPKAVIQIAHGMAEHSARYERFATFLVQSGFAVYAHDYRGHGEYARQNGDLGFIADDNGWELLLEDLRAVTKEINSTYQEIPSFLFGHSMGSYLSRIYMITNPEDFKGVILSSTSGNPGMIGKLGLLLAKREAKNKGKRTPSPLLNKLTFGSFNKAFKPSRTAFDWLSSDEREVDKYVNDPLCGFTCSTGFYCDLLDGMIKLHQYEKSNTINKKMSILIFSGDNDPVGSNGKAVKEVFKKYKSAGVQDLEYKIYKQARHEMLNEKKYQEVHHDILYWITHRL
jgi:alpha-beta hydrolase superfamily lysophospholipase